VEHLYRSRGLGSRARRLSPEDAYRARNADRSRRSRSLRRLATGGKEEHGSEPIVLRDVSAKLDEHVGFGMDGDGQRLAALADVKVRARRVDALCSHVSLRWATIT
jgi:hypothetical protein